MGLCPLSLTRSVPAFVCTVAYPTLPPHGPTLHGDWNPPVCHVPQRCPERVPVIPSLTVPDCISLSFCLSLSLAARLFVLISLSVSLFVSNFLSVSLSHFFSLPSSSYVEYGCMLHIRSSVVDTGGRSLFRVLSRGMRDGYCIADIKYLEDVKVKCSSILDTRWRSGECS